ncbi:hypothetical protein F5Y16DRAFT_413767 [Xylariaceae sp. FL0255]|nr:hypothetical protein F5Y16DRAFT_413767 [Xylariaceae sp. FL0255]
MHPSQFLPFLPAATALIGPRQYISFGNYFSTGPTADGIYIINATTTLVLPALNSPHDGNLGLWPGMGMDNGDLVQGLAISTVGVGSPCDFSSSEDKWCVTASTLQSEQEDGAVYAANPGDHVTYNYLHNPTTGKTDQTVSVNGVVVSTLSTSSGAGGLGWGTAEECQQEACGTVPEHQYLDTVIVMSAADPTYSETLALNGASGNLVTSDGGLTWTVETITIDAYTYS